MDLWTIFEAGISGIILGLLTVFFTCIVAFIIYSFVRRKIDPMGMAIGTVGGNVVATPVALALADKNLEPIVGITTAQIAASVVITALLTEYCAKLPKRNVRQRNNKIMENEVFYKSRNVLVGKNLDLKNDIVIKVLDRKIQTFVM